MTPPRCAVPAAAAPSKRPTCHLRHRRTGLFNHKKGLLKKHETETPSKLGGQKRHLVSIYLQFCCCVVSLCFSVTGPVEIGALDVQECPEPIGGPDANYDGLDDCVVPVVTTTATVRLWVSFFVKP